MSTNLTSELIRRTTRERLLNRETFPESLARNKRVIENGRLQHEMDMQIGQMIIDIRRPLPKKEQSKRRKRLKQTYTPVGRIDWKEYLKLEEAWMKK